MMPFSYAVIYLPDNQRLFFFFRYYYIFFPPVDIRSHGTSERCNLSCVHPTCTKYIGDGNGENVPTKVCSLPFPTD